MPFRMLLRNYAVRRAHFHGMLGDEMQESFWTLCWRAVLRRRRNAWTNVIRFG